MSHFAVPKYDVFEKQNKMLSFSVTLPAPRTTFSKI